MRRNLATAADLFYTAPVKKTLPPKNTSSRSGNPKADFRTTSTSAPPKGRKPAVPARKNDPKHELEPQPLEPERPRLVIPAVPAVGKVAVGEWVWTCRPGFEGDLAQELLLLSPKCAAAPLNGPFVKTSRRPAALPALGRQAMVVQSILSTKTGSITAVAAKISASIRRGLAHENILPTQSNWSLHVWAPDTEEGKTRQASVVSWQAAIVAALAADVPGLPNTAELGRDKLRPADHVVVQVCFPTAETAWVGVTRQGEVPSRFPGGVRRLHLPREAPSRALMKLDEALEWLGVAPGAGDVCVDLGAAPGGWTWGLLKRGARVIAIDLGKLHPDVAKMRNLAYREINAFQFVPPEGVDWLFGDMVWRPLEVAALVARWGKNHWARFFVVNIKLAMKKKVEMIYRIKTILEEAGWRDVKARHLYHDRDEVTFVGHR